ncbi:MAG: hypothetical protein KAH06_09740, partial [Desulfobacterales bacterium]|nr:hypothetical protein [Desulfobacterales bacterium]
MVKIVNLVFLFVLLVVTIQDVSADIIFLKSGRQIKCSKIKKENGMIKCLIDGFEIGYLESDVKSFHRDKKATRKAINNGFTFDIWQSGMDIDGVMNIAAINDVPLYRQGLISEDTHFNPEMCRDYIHTADEFCYNDHLMGKPARVTLYFTPQSKMLEKLMVRLHSSDIDQESSYPKEIESMLSAKYGKPSRHVGPPVEGLFRDSVSWRIKGNCSILMETGTGQVDILYSDLRMNTIGSQERRAIKAIQS